VLSAVFRKGGEVAFLTEELESVFDPGGGCFDAETQGFVPSLVAQIGRVLAKHLTNLGVLTPPKLTDEQKKLVEEKREALQAKGLLEEGAEFPPSAIICPNCYTKAAVRLDGCLTCLQCGDSKCG
jgi:hypothetical protein